MKTAREMMDEIKMMEATRDRLMQTADELRRTYGEAVTKDAETLEDLAAQTDTLIDMGYDLYHDALLSGEGVISDSFQEIKEDLDFIMDIAEAIARRRFSS